MPPGFDSELKDEAAKKKADVYMFGMLVRELLPCTRLPHDLDGLNSFIKELPQNYYQSKWNVGLKRDSRTKLSKAVGFEMIANQLIEHCDSRTEALILLATNKDPECRVSGLEPLEKLVKGLST